jgi:uncharacterized protein (DUF1330 family)
MMAAYFVLMQQVDDIERYREEYIRDVRPLLRKHGAEVLVTGFTFVAAEGDPPTARSSSGLPTWRRRRRFWTTRSTSR